MSRVRHGNEVRNMNTKEIGAKIAALRKKQGITQEALAEQVGVSAQAVSKWENGWNLPDYDNLTEIARALNISQTALMSDDEKFEFVYRSRLFNEDNMFTKIKTLALVDGFENTLKALEFMRKKHSGQFRRISKFVSDGDKVKYINHPLMMACHAYAMGIKDDEIIAAILLHDVVEDTDASLDDLPVTDSIKEIVSLVTFNKPDGMAKEEAKEEYYKRIAENDKAIIVKIIDRCNNLSTMAACFTKQKIVEYIDETEKYIIPLISIIKNKNIQYSNVAFIVKYHIISVIESIKPLI